MPPALRPSTAAVTVVAWRVFSSAKGGALVLHAHPLMGLRAPRPQRRQSRTGHTGSPYTPPHPHPQVAIRIHGASACWVAAGLHRCGEAAGAGMWWLLQRPHYGVV